MTVLTPCEAIRKKCLECLDRSYKAIRECTAEGDCSLWPFRMGKNPNRKGIGGKGHKKGSKEHNS